MFPKKKKYFLPASYAQKQDPRGRCWLRYSSWTSLWQRSWGHLAGRGRAWALSGKPEVHSQGFSFNYVLIWGGLRCSFFSEDLKRV